MRILITGNMGYIGPVLYHELRNNFPQAEIWGFDSGYFAHCLTNAMHLPEREIDRQLFPRLAYRAIYFPANHFRP